MASRACREADQRTRRGILIYRPAALRPHVSRRDIVRTGAEADIEVTAAEGCGCDRPRASPCCPLCAPWADVRIWLGMTELRYFVEKPGDLRTMLMKLTLAAMLVAVSTAASPMIGTETSSTPESQVLRWF